MVGFETLPYWVGELGGMLREIAEHGAQILEVEEQQPLLVGHAEADVEHALLHFVEVHAAATAAAAPSRRWWRAPDGPARRTNPRTRPGTGPARSRSRGSLAALDERLLGLAHLGDAGEIALDVGGEHRDAGAREAFRQHLQRHRLAGAGRAGHQPVPIGERKRETLPALSCSCRRRSCRPCRGPPFS